MKRKSTVYLCLTLLMCLFPFAGMAWKKSGMSSENRTLAEFPALWTEGGWNQEFLPQAGEYFEDHFAYRQELVTADAKLRAGLFGVSTADGVIRGAGGWLYYKDSLNDYLGRDTLSSRAIYDIARTLKLMQDYVERGGRKFIFTVAPNKNSLYDEHMPYYDTLKVGAIRNIDRLEEAMQEQGVNYADLYPVFEQEEEVLYHMRDSHWNNKGAALAASAILDLLEKEHCDYGQMQYTTEQDFEGDLDKMLFPLAVSPEEEIYYQDVFTYTYEGEVESNFDPEIRTVNDTADGGLLMYRDSFGNALLPFFAQEYENARFSRGVPYYLDDMVFDGADTVVMERAERFLPEVGENPPVAQAPLSELDIQDYEEHQGDAENATSCQTEEDGMYLKFCGVIDEIYADVDSPVYFRLDGENVYEAFPMIWNRDGVRSDFGYCVCIEKSRLEDDYGRVELFVTKNGTLQKVYQEDMEYRIESAIAG